jgi:gamma-glutamyltranspeptidase/glutathione hydrolase
MVAASQPLAISAGIEILSKSGNAADAAVAIAAALNVTEPTSTLFFDAKSRQVSALNGSGRAPAALTLERLKKEACLNYLLNCFASLCSRQGPRRRGRRL